MIQRPEDLIPASQALDELKLVAAVGTEHWCKLELGGDGVPRLVTNRSRYMPFLNGITAVHDLTACIAAAEWLRWGCHTAVPTEEQEESLARVEVPLRVRDLTFPFPTIVVESRSRVYKAVVVCLYQGSLILSCHSRTNNDDITTLIHDADTIVEADLGVVEERMKYVADESLAVCRVALNTALALSNYGWVDGPAFPKAAADDEQLAKRPGAVGEKARERLTHRVHRTAFRTRVVIRRTPPGGGGGNDAASGRHTAAHWVRGHWRMQAHGPAMSLRTPKLIRPYMTGVGPAPAHTYEDKR